MRFQARDGAILQALSQYDGVLAKRQVKALFWEQASRRAMELRLSLLYRQGYIQWPSRSDWRTHPIPEPICWLGWKGILWLAGNTASDIPLSQPPRERQLRRLELHLRKNGIRWLREPRWSQLAHDVALVDFRLAVEARLKAIPHLTMESWVTEGTFRTQMDTIVYPLATRTGTVLKRTGVRPDGYFVILDTDRLRQGKAARARYLVEIDNGTHDNPSFGSEKVLPGLVYMSSDEFKARFGDVARRWLVVTTSEARLRHLLRQTELVAGAAARWFLFTTLDQANHENVVVSPIWRQAGQQERVALLTG
jgi:hypothetical protein